MAPTVMTSVICGRPYSRSCASALKATNVSKVSKCAASATSSSYTSFRGPVSLSSAWSVSKSTSSPRSRSVTVRANFGKDSGKSKTPVEKNLTLFIAFCRFSPFENTDLASLRP